MTKIVVIRIIGQQGLNQDIKKTLKLLNLHKKYTCSIVENSPHSLGMIKKIKDLSTWGEISEKSIANLLEKRGRLPGNKPLTKEYLKEKLNSDINTIANEIMEGKKKLKDIPGLKPFFRLTPPRGGFESKGTKKPFSVGGTLGYRKEKINDLIERMI